MGDNQTKGYMKAVRGEIIETTVDEKGRDCPNCAGLRAENKCLQDQNIELRKALIDSRDLFESITCLCTEGPDAIRKIVVIEAIMKGAAKGCKALTDLKELL